MNLREVLARIADGERLTREESRSAMDIIMSGDATPAQIGAYLMGLRVRGGLTAQEIAGAAESMRSRARRVHSDRVPLLDTCGTGGDGAGTFNISTAAAFVAAGGGIAVAKHGNRSVSSRCGSADVLEALGARIDLSLEDVERSIEETGFGFLFAPHHHEAMKHAAGPRKELGVRTLFNVLGPLTNPANATHQVMGVFEASLTEPLAEVLGLLGSEGALVVHGAGGLDELSLEGPSRASRWHRGAVTTSTISPLDAGLAPCSNAELRGGSAAENAERIRSLLGSREGPDRDVVCLNAGAAFFVTGHAEDLRQGVARARETIESGGALAALERFVAFTREAA